MPGRLLARGGGLGQHVIMIEPHLFGAHQLGGQRGQGGVKQRRPIVGIVLPVAEILDELTRIVRIARHLGP